MAVSVPPGTKRSIGSTVTFVEPRHEPTAGALSCQTARELVSAAADDELRGADRLRLADHLDGCADVRCVCRAGGATHPPGAVATDRSRARLRRACAREVAAPAPRSRWLVAAGVGLVRRRHPRAGVPAARVRRARRRSHPHRPPRGCVGGGARGRPRLCRAAAAPCLRAAAAGGCAARHDGGEHVARHAVGQPRRVRGDRPSRRAGGDGAVVDGGRVTRDRAGHAAPARPRHGGHHGRRGRPHGSAPSTT